MKIETIPYEADGLRMIGHLAINEGHTGKRPGVLVFPEAFGLGPHAKSRAERLAGDMGYVAMACDLHGNQQVISDLDRVLPMIAPLRSDADKVRERVLRPLEALAARPEVDPTRIAAIGFCFGGTMAYELALSGAEIRAAIGFHSGLAVSSPQDAGRIRGKVLAMVGAADPSIPGEAREGFGQMLSAAKIDWQMTVFGGVVHGFTNPDADRLGRPEFARYDAAADTRSWRQMGDLLREVFA